MKVNSQPRVIADNSVHEAFREHAKAINWLNDNSGGGSLPSQTGNAGKYLTTDGATASWDTPTAAPAGASGTTSVNFGSKSTDTTATVTGQTSILSGSLVDVRLYPSATASNTADNHWVEDLEVYAGNVVAGTGFTVYAKCRTGFAHGSYNISWKWE